MLRGVRRHHRRFITNLAMKEGAWGILGVTFVTINGVPISCCLKARRGKDVVPEEPRMLPNRGRIKLCTDMKTVRTIRYKYIIDASEVSYRDTLVVIPAGLNLGGVELLNAQRVSQPHSFIIENSLVRFQWRRDCCDGGQ